MVKAKKAKNKKIVKKDNVFQKLSLFAYSNYKLASVVFAVLVVGGLLSYTTLLKREGFPPIQTPLAIGAGGYFVDDAAKIDEEVLQPVVAELLKNEHIDTVTAGTGPNVFSIYASFEGSVSSAEGSDILKEAIVAANIPEQAQIDVPVIDVSKFLNEYTILLSVYGESGASQLELQESAHDLVSQFEGVEGSDVVRVLEPFATGTNPDTGEETVLQTNYSRYGKLESGQVAVGPSVLIGLVVDDNVDALDYSEFVNAKIDELASDPQFAGVNVAVSADNAPSVLTQISSLQSNLFSGLIAVAMISLLLITWRASVVTALFMISVVSVTLLILYFIGYSINTITLFSLVLSLGLFVDDATIIVEAIDASKAKKLRHKDAIRDAIGKVGAASFSGTFTTVLVFLPMAFISGVLGSFIRIMPVTIITALLTSLVLSLTLIPVLSRYILLSTTKRSYSPLGGAVEFVAVRLSALPLIFRKSRAKGWMLTAVMIGISFVFFAQAANYAQKVSFNIFPPSKDSDSISLNIVFDDGLTLDDAETISAEIDELIVNSVDEGIVENVAYSVLSQGIQLSNERSANALVGLKPFTDRDIKSPEIIGIFEEAVADVDGAKILFGQADAGPPVDEFPFKVQIFTTDKEKAGQLAGDLEAFLLGSEVERPNKTTAMIEDVRRNNFTQIVRKDNQQYFEVAAAFDATDTTSLVQSAQKKVEAEFTGEKLAAYGFTSEDINFDFGQESENQDSFASMLVVGLFSMVVMYVLLGVQFRSFVKPFLIFLAVPFSMLGVFAGLYGTDNPLSFFVMVGLFGLIGIAVNNTILLTDYANQERKSGKPIVESISAATHSRFRPLLATSITTVVALLPLALTDPFWEALAFTIIFGLMSSTILVIISFPYYYMLVEGARTRIASEVKKLVRS